MVVVIIVAVIVSSFIFLLKLDSRQILKLNLEQILFKSSILSPEIQEETSTLSAI